jgi:hypothetical protein
MTAWGFSSISKHCSFWGKIIMVHNRLSFLFFSRSEIVYLTIFMQRIIRLAENVIGTFNINGKKTRFFMNNRNALLFTNWMEHLTNKWRMCIRVYYNKIPDARLTRAQNHNIKFNHSYINKAVSEWMYRTRHFVCTPLFITCKLRNDSLRLESGQSFKMVLFDSLGAGGGLKSLYAEGTCLFDRQQQLLVQRLGRRVRRQV